MWTRKFWADLAERSVRAAIWAALGTLGANATGTLTGIDWLGVANIAGYAFVLAALASVVGGRIGADNSGSFLPETVDPPAPRD